MGTFRAYVGVVVSGLVLLAASVFLALQWDVAKLRSSFSAYGSPTEAPTVWLIAASALGGIVLLGAARTLIRGAVALHRAWMAVTRPPARRGPR